MKDLNQQERFLAVIMAVLYGWLALDLCGVAAAQGDDLLLFVTCAMLAASAAVGVWAAVWYRRGKPRKPWFWE
jgi:lipopolysaccharide export LptBFGC system permease protein LptF